MKRYTLKNYLEYLKDNPEHYWFKRRLFGWGWIPATKEGWIIMGIFLVFLMLNGFVLSRVQDPSTFDLTLFFVSIFASIVALILICLKKGERPRWAWGVIEA